MTVTLFVSGLPAETTDESLQALFEQVGRVESASVIVLHQRGLSIGLGFVEMATPSEARRAVRRLNGQAVARRAISVRKARLPQRGDIAWPNRPRTRHR